MSSSDYQSLEDFKPNEKIMIGNTEYIFEAHPIRTKKIDCRPGGQGRVAKLRESKSGRLFAIKSFNYRHSSIVERCNIAKSFSGKTPGMKAARIEVIDPALSVYTYTVSGYPFLAYAVLMPWLPYPTWTDLRGEYGLENYPLPNYSNCRKRALNLANLLNLLWTHSTAHCDICPKNIIIGQNGQNNEIYLIDFENIYHKSLSKPPWGHPMGQSGYRHHYVEQITKSQWCLNGDLFGGALLISELLTWYNPRVREHSCKEWYIDQSDLHNTNKEAFKALKDALRDISPECSNLFYKAWISKNLNECPTMEMWVRAIERTPENLTTPQGTHSFVRVERSRPVGTLPVTAISKQQTGSVHKNIHTTGRRQTERKTRVSEHVKGRRKPTGQPMKQPVSQVKPNPIAQPSHPTSSDVDSLLTILFVLLFIAMCIGIGIWIFS